MLTTLRTGALTLEIAAQYKFLASSKKLTIKLTSVSGHKLYGDIKITLSNAEVVAIKKRDGAIVSDYFNRTFLFTKTGENSFEYNEFIHSGIAASETFIDLPDNGDPVEAFIDNELVDIPSNKYDFFLLDSADTVFSTSKVSIKYPNVGSSGVAGIESLFDEDGAGDLLSINGLTFSFAYTVRIGLSGNVAGTTNIPLVINGYNSPVIL